MGVSMMSAAVVVIVMLLVFGLLLRRGRRFGFPYQRREHFYTNAERLFLGALMRALGQQYLILGKVRLADLVVIDRTLGLKSRLMAFEKIAAETVDFVLCDRRTAKILAVVQLIPLETTAPLSQKMRILDQTCQAASIPCVRFYQRQTYDVSDLRYAVITAMGGSLAQQMGRSAFSV